MPLDEDLFVESTPLNFSFTLINKWCLLLLAPNSSIWPLYIGPQNIPQSNPGCGGFYPSLPVLVHMSLQSMTDPEFSVPFSYSH